MAIKIEELEKEAFYEREIPELPPPDIIAYNELRSCADLFRMYTQGILEIQPEFQREIVWKDAAQTRFIDSLIKQLPIPSMCFSLDYKTEKWQVVDGLQRMHTIIRFLSGEDWELSKLDDIDPRISGQSILNFIDKNSSLHKYFSRIENLTLPITILRCDYSKKSHTNYLFSIFHRLNSGGARLNNQEIRNCIYGGAFNNFLKELNGNPKWMMINKMKRTGGFRFMKEEIILRFFTFHDIYEGYDGHLANFLNNYMNKYKNPSQSFVANKKSLFENTIDIVYESIFEGKVPRKLSISVLEAMLVGVSFNLAFLHKQPKSRIRAMYQHLLTQDEFSDKQLREGLSGKERVKGRIATAKRVFSGK